MVSGRSSYIDFDGKAYINALKKGIIDAMLELRDEIYKEAVKNAASLPFKSNKVRLANGSFTSDAERVDALLKSIETDTFHWINHQVVRTAVKAMERNFSQSFIGLFYEYGTGEKFDVSSGINIIDSSWNVYRVQKAGSPIVTRSKYINGGYWTDLGGNLRKTLSPRGGERDEGFIKYVGDDIEAHYWFRNAYLSVKDKVVERYKRVLEEVHPAKFIHLANRIVLGGGR